MEGNRERSPAEGGRVFARDQAEGGPAREGEREREHELRAVISKSPIHRVLRVWRSASDVLPYVRHFSNVPRVASCE